MANSVLKDIQGPDWPLGFIKVVTPGTPVNLMSVVDPSSVNAPSTPTPGTSGAAEYTVRANQIIFMAYKPGAQPPAAAVNTGLAYIIRVPSSGGTGNKTDSGVIVKILQPGETFVLAPAATVEDVWNPYRYLVDADNANDGVWVTLVIS